jgi:hypothetical protein
MNRLDLQMWIFAVLSNNNAGGGKGGRKRERLRERERERERSGNYLNVQ